MDQTPPTIARLTDDHFGTATGTAFVVLSYGWVLAAIVFTLSRGFDHGLSPIDLVYAGFLRGLFWAVLFSPATLVLAFAVGLVASCRSHPRLSHGSP